MSELWVVNMSDNEEWEWMKANFKLSGPSVSSQLAKYRIKKAMCCCEARLPACPSCQIDLHGECTTPEEQLENIKLTKP